MCKTIKQRVKFNASPATVYDLLADSRKLSAVTGRKATISRKIGGTFSVSGNDVPGLTSILFPVNESFRRGATDGFPKASFRWRL
jgi:hypothetical protein